MIQDFTPSQAQEFFSRPSLIKLVKECLKNAVTDFDPDMSENIKITSELDDYPDELLKEFADLYWIHVHDADYKSDDEVDANYMERVDLILAYYNLPTYFNEEDENQA